VGNDVSRSETLRRRSCPGTLRIHGAKPLAQGTSNWRALIINAVPVLDSVPDNYLDFYTNAPLLELGLEADKVRVAKHPDNVVTYIVDRNINYTNVCVADCGFCAFYRRPKHGEGYTLSFEQIGAKIEETKALGGVQILIQGGHNPYIPFEWYLDLMRYIKRNHPIHIHGFSPSEVDFFSTVFRMDAVEVIRELRKAGLDSIPGGGGRSWSSACAISSRPRRRC
jgi:2-iminoacetate synthase ThiH